MRILGMLHARPDLTLRCPVSTILRGQQMVPIMQAIKPDMACYGVRLLPFGLPACRNRHANIGSPKCT